MAFFRLVKYAIVADSFYNKLLFWQRGGMPMDKITELMVLYDIVSLSFPERCEDLIQEMTEKHRGCLVFAAWP